MYTFYFFLHVLIYYKLQPLSDFFKIVYILTREKRGLKNKKNTFIDFPEKKIRKDILIQKF